MKVEIEKKFSAPSSYFSLLHLLIDNNQFVNYIFSLNIFKTKNILKNLKI